MIRALPFRLENISPAFQEIYFLKGAKSRGYGGFKSMLC